MSSVSQRVVAVDWLRGLVMILMAVAHAGMAFLVDYRFLESPFRWDPSKTIPDIYVTRAITHICAPAFLFLSGFSLYFSISKKIRARQSAWEIDRQLLIRGCLLIVFELAVINVLVGFERGLLLQVLYAIGLSFIFMIGVRRLPVFWICALCVAFFLGSEWLIHTLIALNNGERGVLLASLLAGGVVHTAKPLIFAYPVLPWLAVMALGWCAADYYANHDRRQFVRLLLSMGCVAILLFVVLRTIGGYGNFGIVRQADSAISWFFNSKYPPSLTYYSLELGLIGVLLGLLMLLEQRVPSARKVLWPFAVLGQTALFFYIGHRVAIAIAESWLALPQHTEWWYMYVVGISISLALFPLCVAYAKLRTTYPRYLKYL